MHMISRSCLPGVVLMMGMTLPGCALHKTGDPNHNEKIRYQMAHAHAGELLQAAGSDLDAHDDYDLMIFFRRHNDLVRRIVHRYELYDFLKTSPKPGPERFVIAYDDATRRTYLRSDLRSNENLESLPVVDGSGGR